MNGRCNQYAFSHFAWKIKNGVAYMGAGGLIKQEVFPFSSSDMDVFFACHGTDCICIYSGSVDNCFCGECLLIRCYFVAAVFFVDFFYFIVQEEGNAIGKGVFGQSNSKVEGAYNTSGGGVERSNYIVCQVWLQFLCFKFI